MGNVSHLCSYHYQMMPPRSPAASLDDTSGEQMCSNEFIESSGVRNMAFHYFPVILLRAKSSAVQQEVESPGTEHYQVFTWLNSTYQTAQQHMLIHYYANGQVSSALLDFIFNYTVSSNTYKFSFPSHCL